MPLIDVIFAEGSLSPEAQRQLLNTMWSSALRWEAIEANKVSASIAWAYLDERPRHHIAIGASPITQNIYRINVRVMAGFMDQERVDGMSRELTEAVLAADGGPGDSTGPRVFCIIEEIPSGVWSIDGKIWTVSFTARTLGLDKNRVRAIEKATLENPRIEVKAEAVR
jgi:phenylpyruvate tautomerase PptA (4-oxalocrotonate tautomerase family)